MLAKAGQSWNFFWKIRSYSAFSLLLPSLMYALFSWGHISALIGTVADIKSRTLIPVLDLIRQSCAEESQAGSWRHVQVTVGGGGQLQILYNSWTKCSLIQIWAPSPITSMSTNSLCSVGSNGAHVLHKHTCVLC